MTRFSRMEEDDDVILLGAQFCTDSFYSVSLDAGIKGIAYSLYARIESIGPIEIHEKANGLQMIQIILVDNDGFKLKFLLWGEQMILANFLSLQSFVIDLQDKRTGISLLYGDIIIERNTTEAVFSMRIEDNTGEIWQSYTLFARCRSLGRVGVGHTVYISGPDVYHEEESVRRQTSTCGDWSTFVGDYSCTEVWMILHHLSNYGCCKRSTEFVAVAGKMDSSRPLSHSVDIPAISQGSSEEEFCRSADHPSISRGSAEEESLLSSIEGKLEAFCSSITIFKAPNEISIQDRTVFVPAKVSIGPFHHGAPHLESMEHHKWRYLSAFLKHNPSVTLDDLLELVIKSESRLRKCYEKKFYEIDSDKFAQMMLLDCCFILELLLRYSKKRLRRRNDPVFITPGWLFDLRCDLMLLENQIPYFLLKDVYENVQDPLEENMYLNDLTFRFFKTMVAGERQLVYDNFTVDADHLLEMVHSCFLSTYPRIESNKSELKELPSASTLKTAGIKFKNARAPKSVLDIRFQNGVLEIPPLKVCKQTEAILRNLVAYEIRQNGSAQQVKSYVDFMSHLLRSDEDVKMLCGRKILSDLKDDEKEIIHNLKWMRKQKESLSGTYFVAVVQKLTEGPDACVIRWRRLRRNPVVMGVAAVWVLIVIFVMAFFSAFLVLQRRYK